MEGSYERKVKTDLKNGTWELVKRPLGKKVIGIKLVFITKLNAYGKLNKHNTWLVVKKGMHNRQVWTIGNLLPQLQDMRS